MSGHDQNQTHTQPDDYVHPLAVIFSWVDTKWAREGAMWVIGAIAFGLAILDVFALRDEYLPLAELFDFYSLMGFAGFILAVQVGRLLRQFLMRPEDYYDKAGDDD